jgi:hypothetical protein
MVRGPSTSLRMTDFNIVADATLRLGSEGYLALRVEGIPAAAAASVDGDIDGYLG